MLGLRRAVSAWCSSTGCSWYLKPLKFTAVDQRMLVSEDGTVLADPTVRVPVQYYCSVVATKHNPGEAQSKGTYSPQAQLSPNPLQSLPSGSTRGSRLQRGTARGCGVGISWRGRVRIQHWTSHEPPFACRGEGQSDGMSHFPSSTAASRDAVWPG